MECWNELATKIEQEVYETLESFELVSARYSEKFGKTFVADPALVFRGERCLRWQNTADLKAGVLKVERVPKDWREIEAVEIWVNTPTPLPIEAVIITERDAQKATGGLPSTPARGGAQAGKEIVTSLMDSVNVPAQKGRWQRVFLPVAQFKEQGDPSLAAVKEFRIQIQAGRKYDFLVDEIRLKKKDAAAKGGAAAR